MTIEHDTRSWDVELRVVHEDRVPGVLQFSFVSAEDEGESTRYTWEVPSELVDALHLRGHLSEELLRQQLDRAIAEQGSVDALGSDRHPGEWMGQGE